MRRARRVRASGVSIALSVGWAAVALTAAVGAILLASGISRGASERHD